MKKVKIIFSLLILGFTSQFLFAKDIKVTVIDKEIEIPLEGVVLSVSQQKKTLSENWETDFNGEATVSIPDELLDSQETLTLSAYMPGYAISKVRINSKTENISINLSIEDVLEGKELVVEQETYKETDAKTGISVVITKDQFDTASMIGSVPDVMTAVKTLPGVTYMGSFSQQPSIRGAYPYEMAAVLDGMYVYSPFHWSGAISIFDPQFVQSVKLSHGIFSARYGHGTSGLLDVTTVKPEDESIKFNASISDVITDGVLQLPITDKLGFVFGYRVSYYDTLTWFFDTTGLTSLLIEKTAEESLSAEDREYLKNFKLSDYFDMPYMRDFYGKFYYNPSDRVHISVNEFYGTEGIGFHLDNESLVDEQDLTKENEPYNRETKINRNYEYNNLHTDIYWKNVFSFGSINLQVLPTDRLQLNTKVGYNQYDSAVVIDYKNYTESIYNTTQKETITEYSEPDNYDPISKEPNQGELISSKETITEYDKSGTSKTSFTFRDSYQVNVLQGTASADYSINEGNIVSVGVEEFFKTRTAYKIFEYSTSEKTITTKEEKDLSTGEVNKSQDVYNYLIEPKGLGTDPVEGNKVLNSVAYSTWEFGTDNSKLQGEAGFRFEHYYVYNQAPNSYKRVALSSTPTFNPRVSINYKPQKEDSKVKNLTYSAGAGLFSELNDSVMNLTSKYEIVGGKFLPDQNAFAILGTSFSFLDDFYFQLEGYYKYYINRYYSVGSLTNSNILEKLLQLAMGGEDSTKYINKAFFNGTGHVFGFDTMLQKKTGRYFDGYLCFSFIYANYLNPFQTDKTNYLGQPLQTDSDDPLGTWYYPYFHRFVTLSFVGNYRPTRSLVITLSGSICSGVPISQSGVWAKLYETDESGQRTSISFPINFRIGKSNYFRSSKLQYEWFFGIENIFGFLNKNSLYGAAMYMLSNQDIENFYIYAERLSNFDTGLPTISLGLRISM